MAEWSDAKLVGVGHCRNNPLAHWDFSDNDNLSDPKVRSPPRILNSRVYGTSAYVVALSTHRK
jgi:hypothetical protein